MNAHDRVLVVDDDPALLDALPAALRLRFPSLDTDVASSGPKALEMILAGDYDAIVCDIKMPGMDGLALLSELRARGNPVPVLLITGHGEQGLALEALRGGAYDFIQKPIEREYLIAALSRAMEQRKLARLVARQRETLEKHAAELESKVQRRTGELVAANQVKDEFLAMLGHELRNPIAAVSNALAVLERVRPDSPEAADMKRIIARQARILSRMVDDLLDISRLTQGKLVLERVAVDLKELIERCTDSFRRTGKLDRHHVSLAARSSWVYGDPLRLEQIFSNLLDNALKFTPTDGEIRIRLDPVEGGVKLAVEDQGIGIRPQELTRVFDLFFQTGQSLDRRKGGLGLGLGLVKRFVEMHGGTIEAQSEGIGRGSTFVVHLPLVSAAVPSAVPAAGGVSAPTRRVLLVEDNPDVRDGLRSLLELLGHEVRVAESGDEAIDGYVEFQPEAVLVDIGIPGIDGYEVARQMRALPGRENALVVAVTGYGQPEDRARAEGAGFDAHLVKPVDVDRLLHLLARRMDDAVQPERSRA